MPICGIPKVHIHIKNKSVEKEPSSGPVRCTGDAGPGTRLCGAVSTLAWLCPGHLEASTGVPNLHRLHSPALGQLALLSLLRPLPSCPSPPLVLDAGSAVEAAEQDLSRWRITYYTSTWKENLFLCHKLNPFPPPPGVCVWGSWNTNLTLWHSSNAAWNPSSTKFYFIFVQ